MSLIGSLRSALSALQVTQGAFQVTASNIANVGTEGYTRKTVAQEAIILNNVSAGVRLTAIQRSVDQALLRQIRGQAMKVAELNVREGFLRRTQDLFGTLANNTSYAHTLTELGTAFEALAASPESPVARLDVIDMARRLAKQLSESTTTLQRMRQEADKKIATSLDRVNTILSEISSLNGQISIGVTQKQPIADLEDQRDTYLKELSQLLDISTFERSNGEIVIYNNSGRALLDTTPVTLKHTAAAAVSASVTYLNGIDIIDYNGTSTDITAEIKNGRIAALIKTRDEIMVDLQAEIDRLAEELRDVINGLHNDGTAYPAPTSLTGARTVASTDRPPMTGTFRVTVLDTNGVVVENLDVDLAALSPPSIGQLVTTINGMTNATASIVSGKVVISATGTNSIAVNEMTSAVTVGSNTVGMAHFLGLNNFFDSGDDYDRYLTDRFASATTALGIAGTLTFRHAGTTTAVAYTTGQNLNTISANITAALAAQNITSTVVREGTGFRVQLIDTDNDNFFISDSGTFTSANNLHAGMAGTAGRLIVRKALEDNPALIARAELSNASPLSVGAIALSAGDNTIANKLAAAFASNQSFPAAGSQPISTLRFADYAGSILALNASAANSARTDLDGSETYLKALENQFAASSQVNIDEEMANIIVLQNAFAASARVTSVVSEMLNLLIGITG